MRPTALGTKLCSSPNEVLRTTTIVEEALSWLGTPYELNQGVKGCGVDCSRFIYCVMKNCGLTKEETDVGMIEAVGPDWSSHTDDDKLDHYIFRMLRRAPKILEGFTNHALHPSPGHIACTKTYGARVYDHGGIVVNWPQVIHAAPPKVAVVDARQHWLWAGKLVEFYDPLGGIT